MKYAHAITAILTLSLAITPSVPVQAQAQAPISTDLVGTNTASILQTTLSGFPSCVKWRPTGVCFFLFCTPFGCEVKTSIRVSHYLPDAIVSSYTDPKNHPWTDFGKPMSSILTGAGSSLMKSLLDASADTAREEKEVVTFKTTDAVGNPLAQFAAMAAGGGSVAVPNSVGIPNTEELMKFTYQELPQIMQMWATVPAHVGNTMADDARALASNPGSLLSGITSLPSQLSSIQTPMGNLGSMMSGGMNASFAGGGTGGGGGGGTDGSGGGGTGGGTGGGGGDGSGLDSGSLQSAVRSVGASDDDTLFCPGGTEAFSIYFQSDLDSWFWRSVVPLDLLYPQAWIPGFGEVGNMLTNTWGNLYPRTGELVQSHPAKASAVLAARVQSIASKSAQAHIYKKFEVTASGYVYFAQFSDPYWQAVFPVPENACILFGTNDTIGPFSARDFKTSSTYGYIWNLWQRYECCKSRGIFMFAVP